MHPVLLRIGTFEITSFGAMVAIGALVGLWILRRELNRSKLPADALDAAVAGLVGGLMGAKLLWVGEHFAEEPVLDLLLSRGGMSWFGGFIGGVLAGLSAMQWKRLPKITRTSTRPLPLYPQRAARSSFFDTSTSTPTPKSGRCSASRG